VALKSSALRCAATIVLTAGTSAAWAAANPAADSHGVTTLPLAWGAPFAGLLLSIAIVPLFAPRFWHDHFGKVAAGWALALLVPFTFAFGTAEALHRVAHALLLEYVPFLAVLFALFAIAGGICVRGTFTGTPLLNTGLLALGGALASVMGTTGASMLLIRPLLTANELRPHRTHLVIFFILLVGNVGGALSPLGDPPLFIGFLKGVDFFWTTRALAMPTLFLAAAILVAFFAVDAWLYRRERHLTRGARAGRRFEMEGLPNFALLAGVIGAVLLSGLWRPGVTFTVLDTPVELQNLVRDAVLVALALVSLWTTPAAIREHNQFHWAPIVEVAKIFAAIFVTIFPVLAMLEAGPDGPLGRVIALVGDSEGNLDNLRLFWMTGVLSAFLDNAPTYLVFFNLAGGDAQALMGPLAATLAAISMGAVYFGALTYIGNAPNFMIKAIAEDRGVPMPSFFGYLAYAALVMLPLLAVVSAVWL
jgi:Na+/H+ antiporter NhaD/arsenite permease-like protein